MCHSLAPSSGDFLLCQATDNSVKQTWESERNNHDPIAKGELLSVMAPNQR